MLDEEDALLLIPGPTPVHRETLAALARPTISHTSQQFAQTMAGALNHLKLLADNEDGIVFVVAGTGTLAQEMAVVNFVAPDDKLLVASNGFFATRIAKIAEQHGITVSLKEGQPGSCIHPAELEAAVDEADASVVAFTHVETSTGAMAPLEEYTEVIRRRGARSIVDGVAAFGGVPEPMSKAGIDVLLTGAQKALGVPPGLSIIAVSPEAWQWREERTEPVRGYYTDLTRWAPVMRQPETYFSTHPVNLIRALAKALEIIFEEGVETRFERHRRQAEQFRLALHGFGFEPFTEPPYLAPTLSAVRTPGSVASSELRRRLHGRGVVVAAGIGDNEDRIVRFGHMGNVREADLAFALDAIGKCLRPQANPI